MKNSTQGSRKRMPLLMIESFCQARRLGPSVRFAWNLLSESVDDNVGRRGPRLIPASEPSILVNGGFRLELREVLPDMPFFNHSVTKDVNVVQEKGDVRYD